MSDRGGHWRGKRRELGEDKVLTKGRRMMGKEKPRGEVREQKREEGSEGLAGMRKKDEEARLRERGGTAYLGKGRETPASIKTGERKLQGQNRGVEKG